MVNHKYVTLKIMPISRISNFKYQISNSYQNRAGAGQLALILILVAAISLGVFLVQRRTNILPFAADDCSKATIRGRTPESGTASDGSIRFDWSDGRTSWDYKDSNGNLEPNRSYAERDGRRSTQAKTYNLGSYVVVEWTDGTFEYNYFSDGKFNRSKTYATKSRCDPKDDKDNKESLSNKGKDKDKDKDKKTNTPTPTPTSTATPKPGGTQTIVEPKDATQLREQLNVFHQRFIDQAFNNIKKSQPYKDNLNKLKDLSDKADMMFVDAKNKADECKRSESQACFDAAKKEFDLAKTAGRLAAYYGILANVPEVCAKMDFGLDPLIVVTPQETEKPDITTDGRVYLCSRANGTDRLWGVFKNDFSEFIRLKDTTDWKRNASPADFNQKVKDHIRDAEKLILGASSQSSIPGL